MSPRCPIKVPFSIFERPFLKSVLRGIETYAKTNGSWDLQLSHYYPSLNPFFVAMPKPVGQISGVPKEWILPSLQEPAIPTVFIGYHPRPEWASTVLLDYKSIARRAVKHFTDQGVRQLGSYGSLHHLKHDHQLFRAGIQESAREAGSSLTEYERGSRVSEEGYTPQRELEDLADWVKVLPPRTGIICGDDEHAGRVILACWHAGLHAGQDHFILGCGNDAVYCEGQTPRLSSIQLDYFQMGWTAAEKLDALLNDPEAENETLTVGTSRVVTRRSSRRSGRPGSLVERAVDYIWNHLEQGVTVGMLADAIHTDRRSLSRRFSEELGHSPSDEIRFARLETTKTLLMDHQIPLAVVAQRCGYADQPHMSREIKRATGKSPSAFRFNGAS